MSSEPNLLPAGFPPRPNRETPWRPGMYPRRPDPHQIHELAGPLHRLARQSMRYTDSAVSSYSARTPAARARQVTQPGAKKGAAVQLGSAASTPAKLRFARPSLLLLRPCAELAGRSIATREQLAHNLPVPTAHSRALWVGGKGAQRRRWDPRGLTRAGAGSRTRRYISATPAARSSRATTAAAAMRRGGSSRPARA